MKISGVTAAFWPYSWNNSISAKVTEQKSRFPICVYTKHLQWLNYDQLAEVVAAAGFDGVDLTVRQGGHVQLKNLQNDLPLAVSALDKAGVSPLMMTTGITNVNEQNISLIKTAAELGFKYYRMGYLGYQGVDIEQQLKEYKSQVEQLAELNQQHGIHGSYQNHTGQMVGGAIWDIWLMIRDLNSEFMGCQYDIRHARAEGAFSWPVALKLMSKHIKSIVIKDFQWYPKEDGSWQARSVPLGQGIVDFDQYFRLIGQLNITGPISLHFEYPVLNEEDKKLSHPQKVKKTIAVMKNDLEWLRAMLAKYNLV